jgi:N-methylhydantoinase A/oxoprolinase/acetone carboxylase beta subunit
MQDIRLGVDVSDTITDAVMLDDSGRVRVSAKTPTTPDVTTTALASVIETALPGLGLQATQSLCRPVPVTVLSVQ